MFADAQAYDSFMGRWSRLVAPLLVDFAGFDGAANILDVGSGTGALTAAIAAHDEQHTVVGIDPSAACVAFATAASSSSRVRFAVGNARRLSFGDASFDAAVSLLVFNFIPEPDLALAELRRVVRPGGIIAAAVWDYGAGMQMLRIFWDAVTALAPAAASLDERHMPFCRAGELSALGRASGLREITERGLEAEVRFESVDDYWSPFELGQGPAGNYVASLSADQVEDLRIEVTRRLPPAPFTLRARIWAMRGIN
jgi:ubiquinone/menaquinone biosynthesis C-methylase UbiE